MESLKTAPYLQVEENIFCENCGKQLEDDAIFCPECGQKVQVTNEIMKKEEMKKMDENENRDLSG